MQNEEHSQDGEWRRVHLFVLDLDNGRASLAVELAGRPLADGRMLLSHTLGRASDGRFIPVVHIHERDTKNFIRLLEDSAKRAKELKKLLLAGDALPEPRITITEE